jgi:hypothetical protein
VKKVIFWACMMALIYGVVTLALPDVPQKVVAAYQTAYKAAEQSASHSIEGKPSLSPAFMDKVLSAANSKAAGTGQALYDLSLKYGIDDAYALAFFEHESIYGTTGVARATLSLGNIRCSDGYQCIEGYRAYGSWIAGYVDWYRLIADLYISQWHLTTVEQIVPKYAPSSDGNDVAGYIAAVEKDVVTWRIGQV